MSQFDKRAAEWDADPKRLEMVTNAVNAIVETVDLTPTMTAMELGCGTGIAAILLADKLASITAVDTSEGMLDVLRGKIVQGGHANITPVFADLTCQQSDIGPFDLIYSMMTFHHIKEISSLLAFLYTRLNPGGRLAILDLDSDDGQFHNPQSHVEHHGFDRETFKTMLKTAGFLEITGKTAFVIPRETETGPREFPVFLITAKKS